jgi:hypothetical protein
VARVARLAGALLAETEGAYFLVGDLKEPCDFERAGFAAPGPIDVRARPYVRLTPARRIELGAPRILLAQEGEPLARLLAERLLIERNGSVSERLWRLLLHAHEGAAEVPAAWLGEVPQPVWRIVRDAVLKCS